MLGYESTLQEPLEQMISATRAVAAGTERALIVADLPFGTYEASPAQAFESGAALMRAGAHAVKFEGGVRVAPQIQLLAANGIPVMAHLGFTPQSVHSLGGNRVQAREESAAGALLADAHAVAQAGAFALVLELIPSAVASHVTGQVPIPTIGIGAGSGCDGQVLVWTDMAGMDEWAPSFVRRFGDVRGALTGAAQGYAAAVRDRSYPGPEHSFH
jgi:3-methyl-2-oxobutanoate hydroxymethyltransferase